MTTTTTRGTNRKRLIVIPGATVGERVRLLRLDRELTVEELGAKTGLGNATVSEVERGLRQDLRLATIRSFCKTFNVTASQLLGF